MGNLFSREELESLRRDLVDPVRSFTEEVLDDTVGDAKRFYVARARGVKRRVQSARAETNARMAAIRQEQERMRKQRQRTMRRAAIVLAVLAVVSVLVITLALNNGFSWP